MENGQVNRKNPIQRAADWISRNPYMVLIVIVVGILGALASIYFGFWPKYPHRELTYAVQPVRTAIVQVNHASDIAVTYKGKPIQGDLSAAQIMIVNAGQEPIEANDIKVPITLSISNAVILERYYNTNELAGTGFIVGTNFPSNSISVDWQLIERRDKPIIQIVYAGNRDASITLEGRIKGQGAPKQVSWPSDSKPRWQMVGWYIIVGIVGFIQLLTLWQHKNTKYKITLGRGFVVILVLFGIVLAFVVKHWHLGQ
jgi:hypothetical protein